MPDRPLSPWRQNISLSVLHSTVHTNRYDVSLCVITVDIAQQRKIRNVLIPHCGDKVCTSTDGERTGRNRKSLQCAAL
ncbi:hypothetical protein EYF80_033928 [Liparis tanakae]|uniref:Uncharacterized protein n=1 Tax=Liparis tanakae TaxID=230148 RepID=A0A4Z2GRH5_9TELE|nr:hypothetical protein EYF80_033928 [Liparis tanakae]